MIVPHFPPPPPHYSLYLVLNYGEFIDISFGLLPPPLTVHFKHFLDTGQASSCTKVPGGRDEESKINFYQQWVCQNGKIMIIIKDKVNGDEYGGGGIGISLSFLLPSPCIQ